MQTVSTFRLYLLRATYLLLLVGLGSSIWPLILDIPENLQHMRGVVWSVLTAVSLLAILGIRYPLAMLPLLFFELAWKTVWLLAIGLPLWSADLLDAAHRDTWQSCVFGLVVFLIAIPWPYAWAHYVKRPADRWRGQAA